MKTIIPFFVSQEWQKITQKIKAPSQYGSKTECADQYLQASLSAQALVEKTEDIILKREIYKYILNWLHISSLNGNTQAEQILENTIDSVLQDESFGPKLRYKAAELREARLFQDKIRNYKYSFGVSNPDVAISLSDGSSFRRNIQPSRHKIAEWELAAALRLNQQFPGNAILYEKLIISGERVGGLQKVTALQRTAFSSQAPSELRDMAMNLLSSEDIVELLARTTSLDTGGQKSIIHSTRVHPPRDLSLRLVCPKQGAQTSNEERGVK